MASTTKLQDSDKRRWGEFFDRLAEKNKAMRSLTIAKTALDSRFNRRVA